MHPRQEDSYAQHRNVGLSANVDGGYLSNAIVSRVKNQPSLRHRASNDRVYSLTLVKSTSLVRQNFSIQFVSKTGFFVHSMHEA